MVKKRMTRIYSRRKKEKARHLRAHGWSLGEISLKIAVPKNTISGWVKDIRLTLKQRKRIKEKELTCAALGRPLAAKCLKKKMETWKNGIRNEVKHFGQLSLQNPGIGKLICGLLYLCEGAKYPSTRGLIFANSDPLIIRCFLRLLRRFFDIKEDKLRCRVMHRWDQDIKKLNKYWSNVTGIPLEQFFKTKPDKRTKGKPTLRRDYKGICAIQYSNTSFQFQLQSIGEIIIKSGAGGV
ncbi:hypothetical protein ACFL1K_01860 [Candidatus Omnitrophota bacterium]